MKVDVLLEMTVAANIISDSCPCPDSVSCTDCDVARPLRKARDLIAELIAADEEYDAASLEDFMEKPGANLRVERAKERRAAALLACKGQDHER